MKSCQDIDDRRSFANRLSWLWFSLSFTSILLLRSVFDTSVLSLLSIILFLVPDSSLEDSIEEFVVDFGRNTKRFALGRGWKASVNIGSSSSRPSNNDFLKKKKKEKKEKNGMFCQKYNLSFYPAIYIYILLSYLYSIEKQNN